MHDARLPHRGDRGGSCPVERGEDERVGAEHREPGRDAGDAELGPDGGASLRAPRVPRA